MEKLGAVIRERRQSSGLSHGQFLQASQVSRANLSKIENGKANPSLTTLLNIAKALGVKVGALIEEAQ